MTPLERAAWSKQVQRALRVALTGTRSLRTAYNDECDAGEKHLNAACNHLLRHLHIPAMPLPKELRSSLPDLKEASRAKLCRLCLAHVHALVASADRLAALAWEARSQHACGLDEFITTAEAVEEAGTSSHLQGPGGSSRAGAPPSTTGGGRAPLITAGLGPSRAASLLRQVADHMVLDAADKQAVARIVAAQAMAQMGRNAPQQQPVNDEPFPPPLPERALSERSQVWLSVWMLSPRLAGPAGEEHYDDMLLAGLHEALAAADLAG